MKSFTTKYGQWMSNEFEKGLVSVIIPTYNRAHILSEALDSVWAQTYRPLELIVVDDGSMDDTEKVVEAWLREHQGDNQFELRYFHQENAGAPAARNMGLSQSKGEYIQFLDSDDVLYPNMTFQVVETFESNDCDFVVVGYDKICAECGRLINSYAPDSETDALIAYMTGQLWGHTTSITRRRNLARKIGPWNESLVIDQDGDYTVRTILISRQMAVIRNRLYAYRVQSGLRINHRKNSWVACKCRLQRETKFCEYIAGRDEISSVAKGAYARRLYKKSVSLNYLGIADIGDAFGALAEGIDGAALTWRGKLLQQIWRGGRIGCTVYEEARRIKRAILDKFLSEKHEQSSICPLCDG